MFTRFIVLALLLATWPAGVFANSGVRVIDGDTIDLDGERYRIHGIDAPEAAQACKSADGSEWACGQAALHFLETMVSRGQVICEPREKDVYGRWIAVCRAGDRDVGEEMVAAGLAWAFRKYSGDYIQTEEAARTRGRGIWQSETMAAWDFRALKWENATRESSVAGCPIKGNINRKNEKIYHPPWSKDYDKTKIDTRKGERWFCTEAEALAAGWRPPQWGR